MKCYLIFLNARQWYIWWSIVSICLFSIQCSQYRLSLSCYKYLPLCNYNLLCPSLYLIMIWNWVLPSRFLKCLGVYFLLWFINYMYSLYWELLAILAFNALNVYWTSLACIFLKVLWMLIYFLLYLDTLLHTSSFW